jgi:hypothetical protein
MCFLFLLASSSLRSSVEVKDVIGGDAVDGLRQAVAEAVVGVGRWGNAIGDASEAVGGIKGVGVGTVVQQVAIIVPLAFLLIHFGEPVGIVVFVGGGNRRNTPTLNEALLFAQAIAHWVAGVVEVGAIAIARVTNQYSLS